MGVINTLYYLFGKPIPDSNNWDVEMHATIDAVDAEIKNRENEITQEVADRIADVDAEETARIADTATKLTKTQNLNDLPDKAAARTALDLDTYYAPVALHNTTAMAAPTVNDDSSAGYSKSSFWIDNSVSPGELYRCLDATVGAAVWENTTLTLADLGNSATRDTGTGAGDVAVGNHAHDLDSLTDVDLTGLSDKDQLIYDLATNKFIPVTRIDGAVRLTQHVEAGWADSNTLTITLPDDLSAEGEYRVGVSQKFLFAGQSDATSWDFDAASGADVDIDDSAYAVTITPSAISGNGINLTLGSGNWSASDIGKEIENTAGTGRCYITAVAAGVATANVTEVFPGTSAIASGDWSMWSAQFTATGIEPVNNVHVDGDVVGEAVPGTAVGSAPNSTIIANDTAVFDGKITSVDLHFSSAPSGSGTYKIKVLRNDSGDDFTLMREQSISVSAVTTSQNIVLSPALEIDKDEYVAVYYSDGNLKGEAAGGSGHWYKDPGDFGTTTYNFAASKKIGIKANVDLYYSPEDQYVMAIDNINNEIDIKYVKDIDGFTVTETLNNQTIYYAIDIDGGKTWQVVGNGEAAARLIASNEAAVHSGVEGDWYVNTHATYASETWVAATTNNASTALQEAMAVAANRMIGVDFAAAADTAWPSTDGKLKLRGARIIYTTDAREIPVCDKVVVNYEGDDEYEDITNLCTARSKGLDRVDVTAPNSGGPRDVVISVWG